MSNPNPEAFNAEVISSGISDTNSGILVGVDSPQVNQHPAPSAEVAAPKTEAVVSGKFTEEDLARARQQEKDKLYPQIEAMKETVARLEQERAEREAALAEAQRLEEEEARTRAESETDVRELLKQKEQEWNQRLEQERQEREQALALLDREREFQTLQEYRQTRIAEEQHNIVPELLDMVSGNTPEEIDASLDSLKDRSARILESVQAATQSTRRDMVGARVTAPSTGPMDTHQEQQQFTPESIRDMSMNDYAKNRHRLLSTTGGRGMFG